MSTRGLIFIAGIIVGFFVGMLSFSSHGAGKLYGNCVHTCDNKTSKYNIEQQELRRNIINTIGVILGAIVGVIAFGFITYLVVLGLRV